MLRSENLPGNKYHARQLIFSRGGFNSSISTADHDEKRRVQSFSTKIA